MQVNLINRLENLPGPLNKLAVFPQTAQLVLEVFRGRRQELPRVANSLALILARMAASGLGFITWLVTARLFAAEQVGLASGLVSAMMLLVQLSLIGIGAAFITLYPRYQGRTGRLQDTSLSLVMGAALLGAGGFILLSGRYFQELSIVAHQLGFAFLFILIVLFGAVNSLMDSFSIALRRSDQVLIRNILFGGITIGASVAFRMLFRGHDAIYIIFAWVLAGAGAVMVGAVQMWQSMSGYVFRPRYDRDGGGRLVMTGLPNYLLTLAERAPNWVLPILVTELLSPADNAHWYTLWMMAWAVYQISISMGQNLFADIARNPDMIKQSIAYSHRTSLILGGLAGAVAFVFAPQILSLLGSEYAAEGTLPLRILSLAVFPGIFIQSYYAVCRGTFRLREATVVGLVSGIAGTIAAAFAGIQYGLPGMAVAWLTVQATAGMWAVWRTRLLSQEIPAGVR